MDYGLVYRRRVLTESKNRHLNTHCRQPTQVSSCAKRPNACCPRSIQIETCLRDRAKYRVANGSNDFRTGEDENARMKEQKLIDTNESNSNDLSKNGSVDELTNRNVKIVRKLEESAKQERTKADLVAERIANFCGSMTFVWVHIVWFGGWIGFNIIPGLPHIDPFPFTFLTLVVSLEAIFLSTFILISQNYDAKISERRNHLDLQINLLSEQENTRMLALLRAIAERVGCEIPHEPEIASLSEETDPERVAAQIEQREDAEFTEVNL